MLAPTQPISNLNKVIKVNGKVFYNDRRRRIDLKRPIRDLFEGEAMEIFYTMEVCLNTKKAMDRIKELADKKVLPVIMYFAVKND